MKSSCIIYIFTLLFGHPTFQKYTALQSRVVMTSRRIKNQMKWKKGLIFNLWKHIQATFVPKPLPVNVNTVWMDYPVAVLAAKSGLGDTITLVVWNNRLLCGENRPPPVPTRRHSTPSWALRAATVLAIVLAKGQRTPLHFPTRMANKAGAWLWARLLSEAQNIVTQHQSQLVSSDKSMMGKCTHLEHLLHFIDTRSVFIFFGGRPRLNLKGHVLYSSKML